MTLGKWLLFLDFFSFFFSFCKIGITALFLPILQVGIMSRKESIRDTKGFVLYKPTGEFLA